MAEEGLKWKWQLLKNDVEGLKFLVIWTSGNSKVQLTQPAKFSPI